MTPADLKVEYCRHTLAIVNMDNGIPVLESLGHPADQPLRPLGGSIDGDELEGAFWRGHFDVNTSSD